MIVFSASETLTDLDNIWQCAPDDGGAAAPCDATPWEKLAERVHLDAASRALVLSKNPLDVTSASAPKLSPALADELVTRLEQSIAMDTVRNEYALHAAIHRWLSENPKVSMKDLNREVAHVDRPAERRHRAQPALSGANGQPNGAVERWSTDWPGRSSNTLGSPRWLMTRSGNGSAARFSSYGDAPTTGCPG